MKRLAVPFVFLVILLCFTYSCTTSGNGDSGPVLSSLSPGSKAVNMPGFTLTVNGTGFTEYSAIYFGDTRMQTQFITTGRLQCDIPASLISANEPVGEGGVPVKVNNGGGKVSEKLYFEVRDNNSFYDSTLISVASADCYNPSVSMDSDGNMFLAFVRYDDDEGMYHAAMLTSPDGGMEWNGPVDIYSSVQRIYNVSINGEDVENIYSVFFCSRLLFSSSQDSGETWGPPVELTPVLSSPAESIVDTDSTGGIYILWLLHSDSLDNSIYFQRSYDNGSSFSPARNISTDKDNFSSVYYPALAVDDTGVYTAWTAWPSGGSRYSHVYFNYSKDRGQTWGANDRYFGGAASPSLYAGGEGEVLLAFSSTYIPFDDQIILYRSDNSGKNWGSRVPATSDSNDTKPIVNRDTAGNINIIFERGNGYYYTRSIDGGSLWTEPLFATDRISIGYREKRIGMEINSHGDLFVISEFDFLGMIYLTKSY